MSRQSAPKGVCPELKALFPGRKIHQQSLCEVLLRGMLRFILAAEQRQKCIPSLP
jgi:hypothetical protein